MVAIVSLLVAYQVKTSCLNGDEAPYVVVDPVMISTSGNRLLDEEAQQTMIDCIFPYADILTPNKYEAEALLHRKIKCPRDVEEGTFSLKASR